MTREQLSAKKHAKLTFHVGEKAAPASRYEGSLRPGDSINLMECGLRVLRNHIEKKAAARTTPAIH